MLPDFQKVKEKLEKKFIKELELKIEKNPLLSEIKTQRIYEGSTLATRTIDGFENVNPLQEVQSFFEISNEELMEKGPIAIFDKLDRIASDFISQRTKSLFSRLDEAIEKTGNVVDGEGKPLSPELILQVLEKMAIDFDENGNPIMPALVVHPDQLEKMKKNPELWQINPEFEKQLKKTIEKKRCEWIDRKNSRKLVD